MVECARASLVTFHFALEDVAILLRGVFLAGPLVVLLGALRVVIHPFNGILLHRERRENMSGFYWVH